jgi:hypothetical protein
MPFNALSQNTFARAQWLVVRPGVWRGAMSSGGSSSKMGWGGAMSSGGSSSKMGWIHGELGGSARWVGEEEEKGVFTAKSDE